MRRDFEVGSSMLEGGGPRAAPVPRGMEAEEWDESSLERKEAEEEGFLEAILGEWREWWR